MTKAYSKAIVQRTRFRTKFLKNLTDLNKVLKSKQRNYCVSLLRKKYFPKLNEKEITDNMKFWHTVKPFLLGKVKSKETIILVNNDNIESKETEVAKTLNDFFSNTVKNLEIPECKSEDDLHNRLFRIQVLQAIMKYRNHPSISTLRRFSQHYSR